MGVERAVTRWYLLRQSILNEIAQLEAQLSQPASQLPADPPVADLHQQLAKAQAKLKNLGPCPQPKMG